MALPSGKSSAFFTTTNSSGIWKVIASIPRCYMTSYVLWRKRKEQERECVFFNFLFFFNCFFFFFFFSSFSICLFCSLASSFFLFSFFFYIKSYCFVSWWIQQIKVRLLFRSFFIFFLSSPFSFVFLISFLVSFFRFPVFHSLFSLDFLSFLLHLLFVFVFTFILSIFLYPFPPKMAPFFLSFTVVIHCYINSYFTQSDCRCNRMRWNGKYRTWLKYFVIFIFLFLHGKW